jgi:hypothetical protein
MGYVGNESTNAYSSLPAKQDLTGASGTSLTLSHAVAGPESIDLFINNVRQEPTTAYSVSDTTVTLTGSVVASDDIYVVYNGLALQTIVPPDGSVTSAKLDTNIEVSGILTEPNKEYFQVDLTSRISLIADEAEVVVDFGGSGTVAYDTKSKFDSSNDAYLLDSSDGVYLISFSILFCSDNVGTEELMDIGAQIEVATDGSTFTGLFGQGKRTTDSANATAGSECLSGTHIYKATTATTKLRLAAICDTTGGATYEIRKGVNQNMHSLAFSTDTAYGTHFSVVRIA